MLRNAAIATLIFSGTVAITSPVHALSIGSYNFNGDIPSGAVLAPSGVAPDVSFSSFSASSGITPNSGGFAAGFATPNGIPAGQAINYQNWSATAAINLTKYYEFTVTPNSGSRMTLNSLVFDAQRSPTGPQTIEVRSSLDAYLATLSTLSPGNGSFNPNLTTSFPTPTFQNLTAPTTFRIYGYNAGSTAGTLRLDNVTLDGSTEAVPVPFGFAPGWGIVASGIGMGLRKLKNRRSKSGSDRVSA